jgi:uncharacterized membrane protein
MVASFKDEIKAMDAYKKLNELEALGAISLYDKILVRKMKNGDYETLKAGSSDGWRTLGSMAVGGIIGALGGPIGFIIGLYAGTALGTMSYVNHYAFASDFIEKVEKKVVTGTVSIIVELDEENINFIKLSMKPFGAVVLNSSVDYANDDYMHDQMEEIEEEIAENKVALKMAVGKEKLKIEKTIKTLTQKRKEKMASFETELKQTADEIKHNISSEKGKVKKEVKRIGKNIDVAIKAVKTPIKKRIISKSKAKR